MTALARALALGLVASLALAASAGAHAVVERSKPGQGAELERAPEAVWFRFSEPVEASFGAVRVYDRTGSRVDAGELIRPGGRSDTVGTALEPGLGDGAYTATYRVISADSHPVSGGATFTVGDPRAAAVPVAELIESAGAAPVASAALGVARVGTYMATAGLIGGLCFLLVAWAPALSRLADSRPEWLAAADAFAARLRMMLAVAVAIGAGASVLGIAAQGAIALGGSAWDSLDPGVLGDVLATRFGTVWGLRLVAFVLMALALVGPAPAIGLRTLTPARLGADGSAPVASVRLGRPAAVALVAGLAMLALAPALAGHAGVGETGWLMVGASVAHVLAFSAWAGGLAAILIALPAATRRLEGPDKTRLLAGCLRRFSGLALIAVAALLATGIAQALVQLQAWPDLWQTGYGRAILVKAMLLAVLVGIGALNRRRTVPELDALAARNGSPGRPGVRLRRAVGAEVALIAIVLATTAALAAIAPPNTRTAGPYSTSERLGDARLELTVDPASPGRNEVHLYLFDAASGAPYERVKEIGAELSLPEREIGPLAQDVRAAGPAHYVVRDAQLTAAGEWTLLVTARVSAFDEHTAEISVPVR